MAQARADPAQMGSENALPSGLKQGCGSSSSAGRWQSRAQLSSALTTAAPKASFPAPRQVPLCAGPESNAEPTHNPTKPPVFSGERSETQASSETPEVGVSSCMQTTNQHYGYSQAPYTSFFAFTATNIEWKLAAYAGVSVLSSKLN